MQTTYFVLKHKGVQDFSVFKNVAYS